MLVKMRLLPSLEQTVALAVRLQAAGASVITLHGELAPASPPTPNPTFNPKDTKKHSAGEALQYLKQSAASLSLVFPVVRCPLARIKV